MRQQERRLQVNTSCSKMCNNVSFNTKCQDELVWSVHRLETAHKVSEEKCIQLADEVSTTATMSVVF